MGEVIVRDREYSRALTLQNGQGSIDVFYSYKDIYSHASGTPAEIFILGIHPTDQERMVPVFRDPRRSHQIQYDTGYTGEKTDPVKNGMKAPHGKRVSVDDLDERILRLLATVPDERIIAFLESNKAIVGFKASAYRQETAKMKK